MKLETSGDMGAANVNVGSIRVRLGPIAAAFEGAARVERDPATLSGRIVGIGTDQRSHWRRNRSCGRARTPTRAGIPRRRKRRTRLRSRPCSRLADPTPAAPPRPSRDRPPWGRMGRPAPTGSAW